MQWATNNQVKRIDALGFWKLQRKMNRRIILMWLSLLMAPTLSAKTLGYSAGFDGFLDNREYFSIDNPQTIFGGRTWGEIGADLEGGHRFRAGINYLYEFGSEPFEQLPDITMYYQYEGAHTDLLVGAFPRRDLVRYPIVLLSDTLNYFKPNLEGAYFGYRGNAGGQYVFIDWTSRQTDTRPERFIFGFAGMAQRGVFFVEDYFIMAHLAGSGIRAPGFHLRDNGGFNLNAGLDLGGLTFADSLTVKAGVLVSLDRTRGVDPDWQTPAGFLGKAHFHYRFLGADALYYRGSGHTFFYGDPFYRLESYGRVDLFVMPFRKENISLKINFVMHLAEGQIDYSQQLLLAVGIR